MIPFSVSAADSSAALMAELQASTIGGKAFDIRNYPKKIGADAEFLSFMERGYGTDDFKMEVYIYNPSEREIVEGRWTKIMLAVAFDQNGLATNYESFYLKFVSKTDNHRFYKFTVQDHVSLIDGKNIENRLNAEKRVYVIPEFEVQYMGTEGGKASSVAKKIVFAGNDADKNISLSTSLILANYSVRTDGHLMSEGDFPIWNTELFQIRPGARSSRYSHIIDFDLFRLGNTIMKNAQKSGALEFGVIGITEIGKERQNSLELKEVKKSEDTANQKNDLFNSWLKMARHPGVVDNYTFVKVFTDEQRPESWGADARDLCTVIDISECSDIFLAMPGFLFGDLFYDLFYGKIKNLYYTIRFNRGDHTLFLYLIKNLFEIFLRHYVRIYNRFGVMKMKLGTRAGTMDAEAVYHDYYLAVKKIYSDRFSTDCYSEYFRSRALASKFSLITAKEYEGVRATLDELNEQNSYFIRDLNKTFKKEK